jgi:hypothetical protein
MSVRPAGVRTRFQRKSVLRPSGFGGFPSLVKREEPGGLTLEVRAEAHLLIVHGEVHHAAAELEEFLARNAVAFVLLLGIRGRLLG